jgi:PST family polysaccharide transporter
MEHLKEKTIRGGVARLFAQGTNFFLRIGSLMILARLLSPADFGLVGMVMAFTGALTLFRDFGLSAAAVQRANVTEEQLSTLFWINLFVGVALGLLAIVCAPAIAHFYHEPRLVAVTAVLALAFFFNAAGVQHSAMLQREMRFTALAVINTVALAIGTAIAIWGAKAGYGYWALVVMTVATPFVSTIGFWLTTWWVPGLPQRRAGIRSMMHFGGTVTLNGLVVYIATNFEKVLLGRFWGVDVLGMYGRAYQLINIPTDNLNFAAGEVAFSALSRLQHDPPRLRSYFLKGYSVVVAMTVPITIACALFADDIIRVFLGPKWGGAVPIFRLLSPTILVFAIANPLGWLLSSLGMVGRGLKMSMVIAPAMIASYLIAVPYGPRAVASAYSGVMLLWVVPVIAWSVHGTMISFRDIVHAASRPLISCLVAAVIALGVRSACATMVSPLGRLTLETTTLFAAFAGLLLFVAGQRTLYMDILRGLRRPRETAVT